MEIDRQTGRQTDRETDRETEREERERGIEVERGKEIERGMKMSLVFTSRECRHTHAHKDTQSSRQVHAVQGAELDRTG
jgi:hypothetical protein